MTLRETRRRRIPLGFHVPGLFAFVLAKGVQNQRSLRDIARDFAKLQQAMHVVCPSCSLRTSPIVIWKQADIASLHRQAMSAEYGELLDEVRQQYRRFVFTCPKCSCEGKLPENTLEGTSASCS